MTVALEKPESLADLLGRIRQCKLCAEHLPLGPRPTLAAKASARILVIGQAPGTKVHETGIPWNDPSGNRLREWMDVTREVFYDDARIAIMPMGFCYPGRLSKGGDAPPRPECAPAWHEVVRAQLPEIRLTLLIGGYAQRYYEADGVKRSVTETVKGYAARLPAVLPLPHPSWRSTHWLKRNDWFARDVLPVLRARVAEEL